METANHSGKPMRKNKPSEQEEEMRETPPPSLEMSNTPPHPCDCETPVEGPYSMIRTGMRAGSRVIRNKRYITASKYFYGPWSNQVRSLDLKDV